MSQISLGHIKYHQIAAEDGRSRFICEERRGLEVAEPEPELFVPIICIGLEWVCVIPLKRLKKETNN